VAVEGSGPCFRLRGLGLMGPETLLARQALEVGRYVQTAPEAKAGIADSARIRGENGNCNRERTGRGREVMSWFSSRGSELHPQEAYRQRPDADGASSVGDTTQEARRSFPWKTWTKLNSVCLVGVLLIRAQFSPGEALIVGAWTLIPLNVLLLFQWTQGRAQGKVLAKWHSTRQVRVVLGCAFLVAFVASHLVYYNLVLGEPLPRVFLVGVLSIAVSGGALALGIRGRPGRKSRHGTRTMPPREMM